MNLYTGQINEFVDWISGDNSFTGQNATGGLSVSGGSIRELLQKKLKEPFYMYEDAQNNKYRMFSSSYAYSLWKENPIDNAKLELFNFVRPSDYKLELTASEQNGFNNKYIRYGDSNNSASRIAFHWNIYNDEGESSDTMQATYTITNSASGTVTTFTRWYNRSDADPNIQIYNYLQPGENSVSIECRGTTTGARNSKSYTIVLLQLNLTSTFKFYDKFTSGAVIQIPYTFERNDVSGTAKIYFQIDEGGSGKTAIVDVVQDGPTRTTGIQQMQPVLSEGQHSLQVWVEGKYNDGNVIVTSNLLYFTFVIASSVIGSTNKFLNICQSFVSGDFPLSSLMIHATQYEAQSLQWAYYTDSLQTNTQISITWKLLQGLNDVTPISLSTATANNQQKAPDLQYVPTIYTHDGTDTYLVGYYGNTALATLPIYISKNNKIVINETSFYELKLSAYGRTNESSDKDIWEDTTNNISTTFTGISWSTNSGWYQNSFRTSGVNEYATVNFHPFSNFDFTTGKSIEIEFESEKVLDDNDPIITIGNPEGARIEITPDTATLYNNANNEVIHTNYKSNERIKLCFIINRVPENINDVTVESGLAYIINNGILERSAPAQGQSFATQGAIKIGGSSSGVKVYNIRSYNYSITYTDAYNNFLFDSEEKATIAEKNNILDAGGNISFDLCKNRIDTILISGNLSNILSGQSDKDTSTTDVTIERFCPFDSSKNFKINNVQIRKHGQSTLNYPITSMKFWLNKSKSGTTPTFELTNQDNLLLNKNRYVMKSNTDKLESNSILPIGKASIPANKFVLQANYADSSGVHNGSLQRLIQTSWFNAVIDGEYRLRTEPQLFSTSKLIYHNDSTIGEDGWIEGYGYRNGYPILWRNITTSQFPYDIRISPDSFPCAVFYYDENGSKTRTFLGQYVFMDDKKSDYTYGERSIYAVPSDPFCLTTTYKNEDTNENRVWSNENVLRIEVVGSNVPFSSYMTDQGFEDIVEIQDQATGNITRMYNWEQVFELIYPDEDDIEKDDAKNGIDKFNPNSKYVQKVQPFIDFYKWVVSTRNNQQKFQEEAAQHLDLYKMAAYYIFFLRFGLVDSVERNAQLKTYDGIHWHYEPWDMDIALGNKNDGGIAYDPPIDRNTKLPGSVTTYAFSGRSANQQGEIVTSNWLWDALEAWPQWANVVVPKVADALFAAGLTYDNISKMFDEDYAAKWCEIMYNASGYFKYVESGNGDPTWLSWLQGSRMTHRHWWLSNSMDYYDAKWFCGDYKNHAIYIRANVTEGSDENIRIVPTKNSYMSVTKDGVLQTTRPVSKSDPFVYSMSDGSNTKNPILIYGANFMEELDLSEIALGLDGVSLDGVYSEVLGSPLKKINVGTQLTPTNNGYTTTVGVLGCQIQGTARVFENLTSLNIRGQRNQTDLNVSIYAYDMSEINEVLAMGSGITNFYSSQSGNKFSKIEIPDDVYTIWMNNSSWNNMEFWHCDIGQNNVATLTQVQGIPTTVHEVSFLGTTGSTLESITFVKDWLQALDNANADLGQYTLEMDKVNWSDATVGENNLITFEQLEQIAQLNGARNKLSGYIVLKDSGEELSSNQLTQIKSWFGDTVFTKNSSGLVIDHKRNYIQINIGGNVTVDPVSGDVTIEEGNAASLNATRFSLAEDDATDYNWAVSAPTSNEAFTKYKGITVIQASDSVDGIAYLQSSQSQEGENYDVKVTCSAAGVNYSTVIHVIAATYPSSMKFGMVNLGTTAPRAVPGGIGFYTSGQRADVFVTSDDTYTGVINKITYTIQRRGSNDKAVYIDRGSTTQLEELFDDYLTLGAGETKGMRISADSALSNDLVIYDLNADVLFRSGKKITVSSIIAAGDDTTPIVMSSQSAMYTSINNSWIQQFGSSIGRNSIYKLDLFMLNGTIDFSAQGANLPNLVTANGSYLFKYLDNITGINLNGCINITQTNNSIQGEDKSQFLFDNMISLQNLYIQNCFNLTGTVDLSNCTDIRQVYSNDTNVTIILPTEPKLTNLEEYIPESINLENPTVLQPAGVFISSYENIDSLIIKNIPNLKSYTTFYKIMKNMGTMIYRKALDINTGEIVDLDPSVTYYGSRAITSKIYVSPGDELSFETLRVNQGLYACCIEYDQNGSFLRKFDWSTSTNVPQTSTRTVGNNTAYIIGQITSPKYIKVTNITTNKVIFDWTA